MQSGIEMRFLMVECYFCNSNQNNKSLIFEDDLTKVFRDNYPVSELHTLVTPKSHVPNIFDLDVESFKHLFMITKIEANKIVDLDKYVTGFNVGVNQGLSAGQTIMHAHIHIIPRRDGDVADPKGGVRWVLPDKADYWSAR